MRILIDMLHPADVHLFRNFIFDMGDRGHDILITSRVKDVTVQLLDYYGLKHQVLSEISGGMPGLAREFTKRCIKLAKVCQRHKPDLLLGMTGPIIAVVGFFLRIPRVVFYDTEIAKLTNCFVQPLSTSFVTPSCYNKKVRGNHVTYPSYQELAYLHPNRFSPNPAALRDFGLSEGERFFIMRLVSWQASHDIGHGGLDDAMGLIRDLEKHGRVLVVNESPEKGEISRYEIKVAPEHILDLLYYSSMYIGEGATMASEAACLGTPAILINSLLKRMGYIRELEDVYGALYSFDNAVEARERIKSLLKEGDLKDRWGKKREKIMGDKVDLTSWMVEYVETEKWAGAD